ncbi:unnamed protein product [Fructobacillus cardui]|uniref:hypothetical protein n=1 Tax=Fructobacillus cardui TaxID=2893170 RepID=UPI002DA01AEE|nr:unnamed protein product [Fructobacillus cardui]
MKNADSSSLSIILGILSSILTIATPFGTIILVGGYPIFGKNIILCIFSVMAIIAAIIIQVGKAPKENTK